MKLRELTLADAPRCAEMEQELFSAETPWSAEMIIGEMTKAHTFYFGVETDGKLIGYAGIAMMGPASHPEFELHTIGTDPEFQGRGAGKLMMDNIVHIADLKHAPVFLEVRADNAPAVSLYERYEFENLGLRKNYYGPGVHAVTMRREGASQS